MADLSWVPDLIKTAGGAAVGWFGKSAADRARRRVMQRGLYKEMAYNASMLAAFTAPQQLNDGDDALRRLTEYALRTSYFQQARANRLAFDELNDSYAIEDVIEGFAWILKDTSAYPSGVVYSRMRGALYRIKHFLDNRSLDRRLLLRMAPRHHRDSLEGTFASLKDS